MKPITANKGYNEYVTHFSGLSGHASDPNSGVSAIEYAIEYSNKLLELRDALKKEKWRNIYLLRLTQLFKSEKFGGDGCKCHS